MTTPDPNAVPAPNAAPGPGVPPPALVRSPLSDGEWHRLHPLTPLLRGGLFLLVVIGIVVANLRDRLIAIFFPWTGEDGVDVDMQGDPVDFVIDNNLYLVALLIVVGVLAVLVGGFYLSWRFHTFRITDDDVEVRSGILFRTQRRAPLDRVQGVNLTRPMIARLLGMAKLEVIGAGADGNVRLEYLSTENSEAVRADILRLASGQRLAEESARREAAGSRGAAIGQTVSRGLTGLIEGDEAPVAEPESVVDIPVARLILSHVVSTTTVMLILGVVAVSVGAIRGTPWLLFAIIPGLIGVGAYWVRSIIRSLRYSIAPTPDGVRITFGLLTTITETVPPGRIHAVEITQPILWRPFGWWAIRINRLSGRNAADTSADQFTTALPVGTAADVERVLRLLQPRVPAGEWGMIVAQGMVGPGRRRVKPVGAGGAEGDAGSTDAAADGFRTSPRRAWPLRPLSWRRNGFRLTPDLLLLRRGFIWRRLAIVPLARLQSIGIDQGPLDRALRVAALRAHIVSGPVYASLGAIDRDDAVAAFDDIAHAVVAAAGDDRSHRWAEYLTPESPVAAEVPDGAETLTASDNPALPAPPAESERRT
ncbi:PH domain-containing protein [Microbacterium chocolatum]|uniref:PH domain-containing protein n=1 Tax=Microbacterium aurantiacum TaxID=162393 RepID=UPI00339074D1